MRYPAELPAIIRDQTLTPALLRSVGLHPQRLAKAGVVRVSRGIYLRSQDGAEPTDLRRSHALGSSLPTSCLSHVTAARMLGLELPWEVADDDAVHLTQPAGTTRRIRRPGVVGHRRAVRTSEAAVIDGVWVTTPARTWFDLAERCSLRSLVMLGDHLVRIPRFRFEGRSEPHATIAELRQTVRAAGRVKGKGKAREALELIRVGADSFKETELRLALVDAGLPEPEVQVPLDPDDPCSPCADAGYRGARIAIQYDGETHFDPDQQRKDQTRDNGFVSAGWIVLRFNRDDARTDFRSAVIQVRRALQLRGAL